MPQPTVGRIVHYQLSGSDVTVIDQRCPLVNTSGQTLRNSVREGSVLPAMVTAVFGPGCANLKVSLDGLGEYWATSRAEGDAPGQWSWPPRV